MKVPARTVIAAAAATSMARREKSGRAGSGAGAGSAAATGSEPQGAGVEGGRGQSGQGRQFREGRAPLAQRLVPVGPQQQVDAGFWAFTWHEQAPVRKTHASASTSWLIPAPTMA